MTSTQTWEGIDPGRATGVKGTTESRFIIDDRDTPRFRVHRSTMIDQEVLAEAMERLGRKLAFFVRLRIWDREKEYGDYSELQRTFFLPDF